MSESAKLNKLQAASLSSLAHQVFGKPSASLPLHPTSDAAPGFERAIVPSTGPFAVEQTPPARRVLPDLLTVLVDPVEQRAMQEVEERVRRRSRRVTSPKVGKQAAVSLDQSLVPDRIAQTQCGLVEGPGEAEPAKPESRATNPTEPTDETNVSKTTRKPLKAVAMRAERTGRPLPRLPLGERWKRRLPKVCW